MKNKKIILFFCFMMIISFAYFFMRTKDRNYHVKEEYIIQSKKGTKSFLDIYLPIGYGYQYISELSVNNVEKYYLEQKDGYQILNIELLGNGNKQAIDVTYNAKLMSGINVWDENYSKEDLKPDEFIDCNDENIINSAKKLVIEGSDYETAKNISKFVSKTIKMDRSDKINEQTLKASEVLKKGDGVCQDYANLMVAMLRSVNIPAKSISGLVYNDLKKPNDWQHSANNGSHAWVEFYTDGKWHFADPTWGNKYFDKTDGYHMSYGSQIVAIDSKEYKKMISNIEDSGYTILGSMTSPLKFTAWSEDSTAIITPKVTVNKIN